MDWDSRISTCIDRKIDRWVYGGGEERHTCELISIYLIERVSGTLYSWKIKKWKWKQNISSSEHDQNEAYKEKLEKIIVFPWKKLGREWEETFAFNFITFHTYHVLLLYFQRDDEQFTGYIMCETTDHFLSSQ